MLVVGAYEPMRLWRSILFLALGVALIIAFLLPATRRAHAYSGPGVHGNLMRLQEAKDRWEHEHPAGPAWPRREDLLPYLGPTSPNHGSFDDAIRPLWGEIYLINSTGAPVFAYFPKDARGYRKGHVVSLSPEKGAWLQKLLQDEWSKADLTKPQLDGAANRSQPIRPETNRTSAAAGSDR
jgi:hypothetical protein